MPKNATLEQRVRWHVRHAAACACREIPAKIVTELRRRGVKLPKPGTVGSLAGGSRKQRV